MNSNLILIVLEFGAKVHTHYSNIIVFQYHKLIINLIKYVHHGYHDRSGISRIDAPSIYYLRWSSDVTGSEFTRTGSCITGSDFTGTGSHEPEQEMKGI